MLKKYLNEVLGLDIDVKKLDDKKTNKLPMYLLEKNEYYSFHILNNDCILVKPLGNEGNIKNTKNQLQRFLKEEKNIIFLFDKLTSYQKKFLIENRINFIVPMSQCFLPFIGVSLKEEFVNELKKKEKLSANAQVILLYMIYNPKNKYYSSELADVTNLSAMNVSRGIKELEGFNLINSFKDGKEKYSVPKTLNKELYLLAKEVLDSPVAKTIYIKHDAVCSDFIKAGESALAEISMLSEPRYEIYAINKKDKKLLVKDSDIVDPNWSNEFFVKLELWNYSPKIHAKDGIADIISVSESVRKLDDERINAELKRVMENWNDYRIK